MTTLQKPDYFDVIQQKSLDLWHQLEENRELAAPWHQLFKQAQNPRHVLSELLQNADDAEATEVIVQVKDGIFFFTHNGKDFNKDDFASLCRFGYSNKRLLHTIGFRGIGFKSTFSLGDTVELRSPTLVVAFHKSRFTLPQWLDQKATLDGTTQISVKFGDEQRQKEMEKLVTEWLNSPFSLLFFNHIRSLKIGEQELSWKSSGPGPISNSVITTLNGDNTPYVVIRSEAEPFPAEALKEINEERLLDAGESANLPPCRVELVLGAPGQLFVVLPTGVKTNLAFAVNAPFIQDPARLKVKEPETSFTNRWLLERVGKLAAQAMIQWLENQDLDVSERAQAYDPMPEIDKKGDALENSCQIIIEKAFFSEVQGQAYVLANNGDLALPGKSACVPEILWDIWNETQIAEILSKEGEKPLLLSRYVNENNRKKLCARQAVSSYEQDDILSLLRSLAPPQPTTWASLLELWNFAGRQYYWSSKDLNIHPVRGRRMLFSANKIVRLGEKRLLQSEEDWDFLAKHLLVLDVNWLRFLTEQHRVSEETGNILLREKVEAANQFLHRVGLDTPSNADGVLEKVAKDFYADTSLDLDDCVRITQIASKLNARTGDNFKFFTQDGKLRHTNETIVFDESGLLEEFIPPPLRKQVLLHEQYTRHFRSCAKEEWLEWLDSGNAGIGSFAPIGSTNQRIYGDDHIEKEVEKHGQSSGAIVRHYITSDYELEDWDFPGEYWKYWETCARNDPSFWARLVEQILYQPRNWEYAGNARAFHIATTGNRKQLVYKPLLPTWILKFRELPCLRDSRGAYRLPHDLMRRTPQTEPLMDIEPFVDARLDSEARRPLLTLLGVRDTPTSPTHILERIRALSKAPKPPVLELAKWYQRLDAFFDGCSTEDQQNVSECFRTEKLILADDGTRQTSESIYISADEHDVPGAALVYSHVNQLSIWRKIGVNERPTAELAIQWLMRLPMNEKPSASDAQRIKSLLGRHPIRVWKECKRWLNLLGEWIPIDGLRYCLTMKSLFRYANLFEWVKSETADFQMLRVDLTGELPFSALPALASQVEKKLESLSENGREVTLNWLQTLGRLLSRINLNDEIKTQHIRTQANRLSTTVGVQTNSITTIPYLDGKPAGSTENEELVWIGQMINMTHLSNAKLANRISKQIAAVFDWPEMEALLAYCYDRKEAEIRSYVEENFELVPEERIPLADNITASRDEHHNQTGGHRTVSVTETLPGAASQEESISTLDTYTPGIENGYDDNSLADFEPLHPTRSRITPQTKAPLIERFALSLGYQKVDAHRFTCADGKALIKSEGVFPWVVQNANGEISHYYWPREHCLELKPLDLPTEVWHLLEQDPQHHTLLLEDRSENLIPFSGNELTGLKQAGHLRLYPSAYRISLQKDF